jgi:hypothetical protein
MMHRRFLKRGSEDEAFQPGPDPCGALRLVLGDPLIAGHHDPVCGLVLSEPLDPSLVVGLLIESVVAHEANMASRRSFGFQKAMKTGSENRGRTIVEEGSQAWSFFSKRTARRTAATGTR